MLVWVIVAVLIGALGLWIVLSGPAASPSLTDLTLNVADTTLTWTLDPDGATLRDFEVRIQESGQADVVRTTTIPRLNLSQLLNDGVSYTFVVTARFDDADDVRAEIFTTPTLHSLVDTTSDVTTSVVLAPPTGYIQYQSTIDLPALVESTTFDIHVQINENSVCRFVFGSDAMSITLMSIPASSVSIDASLPREFTIMMKAQVTADATNVSATISTSTGVLAHALMTTDVPVISSASDPPSGLVNYNVTDGAGLQPVIRFRGTSFSTLECAELFTRFLVADQVPSTVSFVFSPDSPTTYMMHEMNIIVPAPTQTVRLTLTFPVLSMGSACEFVLTADGVWTMDLDNACEHTGSIETTGTTTWIKLRVFGEFSRTANSHVAVSVLQRGQQAEAQLATIPWELGPVQTTPVHAHVHVRADGYPSDSVWSADGNPSGAAEMKTRIAQSTQPNHWPTAIGIYTTCPDYPIV